MKTLLRALLLVPLAVPLAGQQPAVAEPAQAVGLTAEHIARVRTVTALYVEAGRVAFTRSEPRLHGDQPGGARTHLYLLENGAERLLIGGEQSVRGVAWEPGGSRITFVDRREGDEHAEVYAIAVDSGDIERVTRTPHGVGGYAWRPDGQAIAYTITDPAADVDREAREMGFAPSIYNEDFRHVSLWLWEKDGSRCHRLTSDVTVMAFHWNPAGTAIAAAIAPRNLTDDSYMFQRLHIVNPENSKVRALVDNPGKLGQFVWSADGTKLAFIGAVDRRDPHAGMLHVVDVASGTSRCVTPDFKGMVHQIEWRAADRLRAVVSTGVSTAFAEISASDGKIHFDESGRGPAFRSFAGADGDSAWVVASTASHPGEVFRYDGATFERQTDSNPWLADLALGKQEVVRFNARDGLEIEGVLMHPLAKFGTRDRPLVIVAHGGPEAHHSNGWLTGYSTWGQALTARGYYVWFPNYRASTGYGVEFAKADHGDPMGAEFRDHLDAIDHFAKAGLIDRKRVGVGGGSYGGYTAAWAATRHSEHFAAAVSFVPFVDIRTKWFTSDIPWEFYYVHYEEKWPHEQRPLLSNRSPLTWAQDCRTPLLLLGGTSDPRVHPSQPFMLYSAVKFTTKTPVRYVRYAGEGHGNRSNVNRYDYCVRTMRWFDHYLREGAARSDAPPPYRVDYTAWEGLGG